MADTDALTDAVYDPSHTSRPSYVLLAPGAVITSFGHPSDADIRAVLPIPYP